MNMNSEEARAWLRLLLTPGVGPVSVRRLLAALGSPQAVGAASAATLCQLVPAREAQALAAPGDEARARFEDQWARTAGWLADVEASLQAQGLEYCLYTGVSPNPRVDEVMLGAEIYRANNCNVIVAIGGGSPMDCAKGIGIVVAHGRSILEFEGVDTIRVPSPPLILIPTTAGTSADVSQFVIISNQQERMKFSIVSKAVVPDVSLIDPETTLSMDPFLSACTGIDALVHAIEAFVSTGHGPLTDPHALEAMRLINMRIAADLEHERMREPRYVAEHRDEGQQVEREQPVIGPAPARAGAAQRGDADERGDHHLQVRNQLFLGDG